MKIQNNKKSAIIKLAVVFLIIIAGQILTMNAAYYARVYGIDVPMALLITVCELFTLLPALIALRIGKENILESLGFRKIRISTLMLTLLLTVLSYPVFIFANLFSQLFTTNIVLQASSQIAGSTFLTAVVAIIGPIVEEIVFRGYFFNKLKGIAPVVLSAIISAVLFGVFHLNLNQFCYAFAVGVIFALAKYVSGSIWVPMIVHCLINIFGLVALFLDRMSSDGMAAQVAEGAVEARLPMEQLLPAVGAYAVISLICIGLIRIVLKAMAKCQHNQEALDTLFAGKNKNATNVSKLAHNA